MSIMKAITFIRDLTEEAFNKCQDLQVWKALLSLDQNVVRRVMQIDDTAVVNCKDFKPTAQISLVVLIS